MPMILMAVHKQFGHAKFDPIAKLSHIQGYAWENIATHATMQYSIIFFTTDKTS